MQHNQSVEASAKLHAAQVRARLFDKPRPKPVLSIAPPPAKPTFRQDYEDVMAMPVWRRPYWARVQITFNNHVIDYKRMMLGRETDAEEQSIFRRSMKDIALEVLKNFPGVTLEEIRGPRRDRSLIIPRHIAIHRIKSERPDLSYPIMGQFFGGRDHATLIYAVKKIEKMVSEGAI